MPGLPDRKFEFLKGEFEGEGKREKGTGINKLNFKLPNCLASNP